MLRVLIIEDDENTLQGLQDLLMHEGFLVNGAGSGKKAMTVFKNNTFDIVLCDYRLPDSNGLQICSELLLAQPELEVMMFTAYSSSNIISKAKNIGIRKVFAKPLSLDLLFDELDGVKMDLQKAEDLTQVL